PKTRPLVLYDAPVPPSAEHGARQLLQPPGAVVFAAPRERPHCLCHPDPVLPAREPEHVRDLLPGVRSGDDHLQRLTPAGQSGAGQASAAQSPATSAVAITRSGRSRTSSSPGTAFRRPNSSARAAPMYRPAIAVAKRSSSSRSSTSVTGPRMWTNANGATSSSTTIAARRSRRRFRPLTESPQVVNTNSSPSRANHTGITCGWPPGPLVATLAVRVPWLRKARISSGVIL